MDVEWEGGNDGEREGLREEWKKREVGERNRLHIIFMFSKPLGEGLFELKFAHKEVRVHGVSHAILFFTKVK